MATLEIENRIQELEPQFLQALSDYLDYLFFQQKNRSAKNGKQAKPAAKPRKVTSAAKSFSEAEAAERLRVLRQFKGIAPKPHFTMTKYDVYEQ